MSPRKLSKENASMLSVEPRPSKWPVGKEKDWGRFGFCRSGKSLRSWSRMSRSSIAGAAFSGVDLVGVDLRDLRSRMVNL